MNVASSPEKIYLKRTRAPPPPLFFHSYTSHTLTLSLSFSESELQERLRQEQDTSYFASLRKRGARGFLLRPNKKKSSSANASIGVPGLRTRRCSLDGLPLEYPRVVSTRERNRSLTIQELGNLVPTSKHATPDTTDPQPLPSSPRHNTTNTNNLTQQTQHTSPLVGVPEKVSPNSRRPRNRGVTQRNRRRASLDGSDLGQFQSNVFAKGVTSWTPNDVSVWLASLGLPRDSTATINIIFSRINAPMGVDGPTLLTLTPEDLRSHGALTPLSPNTTTPTTETNGCGVQEQDLATLFAAIATLQDSRQRRRVA